MLSLIHLISIKFAVIFYNESLTFDFDDKLKGVMTCQFTAIEGTLIRNGDEGLRGAEGGPGRNGQRGKAEGTERVGEEHCMQNGQG